MAASIGALYPGTFDPITRGHEALIKRSVRMFDRVVVAVASSPRKAPLLTLDERVALVREVTAEMDGEISVIGYDGLTVDVAREHGLGVIVRGLRTASDFEYEFQLATMNRQLNPDIDTVLLTPAADQTFISATLIREIAEHGGDISTFVHPTVALGLKRKFDVGAS
jgi:pantetheine-phosphate adenylyltransferase